MKYMTINNRKVAFDDEKNVLSDYQKSRELICRHSVIILNFLLMAPAVCVW